MYSLSTVDIVPGDVYPEREDPPIGKANRLVSGLSGLFARWVRPRSGRFGQIVDAVETHGGRMVGWSDQETLKASRELGMRFRRHGVTEDLVAQCFALVRETAGGTVGVRHSESQLIGGSVLLRGMVAEMETGECRALTAVLPACTLALSGVPVHIITASDYLAERDAARMGPVYEAMGLRVGVITNGLDFESRRNAYRCGITYCSNREIAFDYLRDRVLLWDRPTRIRLQMERLRGNASRVNRLLLRGLHFAIVDDADTILIDEARTPLVISEQSHGVYTPEMCRMAMAASVSLEAGHDFTFPAGKVDAELTSEGVSLIQDQKWRIPGADVSQEGFAELVRIALVATHLMRRGKHYSVDNGSLRMMDASPTAVTMDGSRRQILQRLLEIKEGCDVEGEREMRARLSYQNFFRRYLGLSGMAATAREASAELWSVYRMRVVTIRSRSGSNRQYLPERIYANAEQKWQAVVGTVSESHRDGRPVLVGTGSAQASAYLSDLLQGSGLDNTVLTGRQDKEELEQIALAGYPNRITIVTDMAGRGTDIDLGPGVAKLGGLHVIATERYESRRIDRKLLEHCGQRGDPGICEVIASLEDEIVRLHGGRVLPRIIAAIMGSSLEAIGRWLGLILIRWSQRAAERVHVRVRQNLLRMDEQLSDSLAFTGRLE